MLLTTFFCSCVFPLVSWYFLVFSSLCPLLSFLCRCLLLSAPTFLPPPRPPSLSFFSPFPSFLFLFLHLPSLSSSSSFPLLLSHNTSSWVIIFTSFVSTVIFILMTFRSIAPAHMSAPSSLSRLTLTPGHWIFSAECSFHRHFKLNMSQTADIYLHSKMLYFSYPFHLLEWHHRPPRWFGRTWIFPFLYFPTLAL